MSTDSMLTLSSYMLKNAVLCCQARNEQKETANCMEEVLQHLSDSVDKNRLPAYFMPKVNLWRSVDDKTVPPREILGLLMEYLLKTLKESSQESQESFNFRHVRARIRSLQRQFAKIELDALDTFGKPMLTLPKPAGRLGKVLQFLRRRVAWNLMFTVFVISGAYILRRASKK